MSDFLSGLKTVLNPVHGSGVMTEETRPLENVRGVVLELSGDLAIQIGEPEGLVLRGEDNILPLIETPVKDGRVKIRYKLNTSISTHRHLQFVLTVKDLDWVETTSAGDIDVPEVRASTLTLSAKGSGRIDTGNLVADELHCRQTSSGAIEIAQAETRLLSAHISGSGNLQINGGRAQKLDLRTQSSGGLRAPALQAGSEAADVIKIDSSGSGDSEIGAVYAAEASFRLVSAGKAVVHHLRADLITARLSGSGDLKILSGSARAQQVDLSSAGKYLSGDLKAGEQPAEESQVKISGSGSAYPGELKAERVGIILLSAGSLMARSVECGALRAEVKGSGNISIEEGRAGTVDVLLTSGGNLTFRELQTGDAPAEHALVKVSGSGNARLGSLNAKTVELITESAGDIRLESLRAETLLADLKGSGSVHARRGQVPIANIHIFSAGDFLALDVQTVTANIRSSGSGEVKLSVQDRLDAVITSSGDVTYRGRPIVSYSKDGSGEIKRSKS